MKNRILFGSLFVIGVVWPGDVSWGKSNAPLPQTAFDGGRFSAESTGRGQTFASNLGSPASSSENPAALNSELGSGMYTTVQVGQTSDLPSSQIDSLDPLQGKVLNYLSMSSGKGTLFFEPLGRRNENQILNPATPTTDFRDIEFNANAIGFAGGQRYKRWAFGLSIAYLRASLAQTLHRSGLPETSDLDAGDGVRTNFGFQAPTGPMVWGMVIQNAPGFIWWKDHRRQLLPVKVRVGNTWAVRKGTFLSVEAEQRYYKEGANKEDFLYVGVESTVSKYFVYRAGVFSGQIEKPEKRHYTLGISAKSESGISLSYAFEQFELTNEKVINSVLSVLLPFAGVDVDAE